MKEQIIIDSKTIHSVTSVDKHWSYTRKHNEHVVQALQLALSALNVADGDTHYITKITIRSDRAVITYRRQEDAET
jgi:hypothetical protein